MDDVAALIIAAGKSVSPEAFDPAKQVGSISAAERLAVLFKTAGIGRVVLVEAAGQKMERQTGRLGVVCLQMETGEGPCLHAARFAADQRRHQQKPRASARG